MKNFKLYFLIITILIFTLSMPYAEADNKEILTREELAQIIQQTFKIGDNEKMTDQEKTFLKQTIDEATYTLKTYKERILDAEKKQKEIKKDFFDILKNNTSITGNDFDLTLTTKLDYNQFDYDDLSKTSFHGFRNINYVDMLWKPYFDTKIKIEFFMDDLDWNNTAGNDPIRTDIIREAYLETDKLTFGHFPFTLGGGSLLDARIDGIVYKNNDLEFFFIEEGATSADDPFNVWGISYSINKELQLYFSSITMKGQSKRTPLGIYYNKAIDKDNNIQTELLFHKYKDGVNIASDPLKTDDLFTSMSIDYSWRNTINLCYTNMKEGQSFSIGGNGSFLSDDIDLSGKLYSDLGYDGNVEDIYLRYDLDLESVSISFIYETFRAADLPAGVINNSIDVKTIAFNRPIHENCDFDLFYTTIENDTLNNSGLIADINDLYAPTLLTTGADENILKMQLTYHF